MNVCTFIGRVGKDAILRHTKDGTPVLGWSAAVDSGYGDNKTTLWIDCSLWGARAQKLSEYIHKGDRLGFTGELGTREYEGKTYITLRVQDVTLLGDRTQSENKRTQYENDGPKAAPQQQGAPAADFVDDHVPF